jgi:hypothetical protein
MSATRYLFGTTMAVFGLAAALTAAQQPPAQPATTPPAIMTISGCLRAGPNPSMVPDSVTYTLEPIETAPVVSPGGAEPARPKTGTRYTLTTTASSLDLKPHVGHKIEITGHLKDLSTADPGTRPDRDPQAKPPQPGGAHNTFEVSSMKMVSATCP